MSDLGHNVLGDTFVQILPTILGRVDIEMQSRDTTLAFFVFEQDPGQLGSTCPDTTHFKLRRRC